MQKIIILKGLPASGKSTWAKALIDSEPGKWKRTNKDDLRAMIDNGHWSKENEEFVKEVRNIFISAAIVSGYNVIVDDTNLSPNHEADIRKMAELMNKKGKVKVEVEIKDFTDVPLETCLIRDSERPNSVGKKVIMQMYNQFLKPKPLEYDPKLPECIVCDIDGTLALFGGKNPYNRDFENDEVNQPVAKMVRSLAEQGMKIIYVSGRSDKFKQVTLDWLAKNDLGFAEPFMRKEGDSRKDVIIKQEIYEANIKGKYNVLFVLDDRNQVVNFWRSQRLTCFQVADGNF